MLNNENLSKLLIKQGKSSFVWDLTVISKENNILVFVDNDSKRRIEFSVKTLTKASFLKSVKEHFDSEPFSIYLEIPTEPLQCDCDGCTDGEDEEVEIKISTASELLELLHGVFDRREGA